MLAHALVCYIICEYISKSCFAISVSCTGGDTFTLIPLRGSYFALKTLGRSFVPCCLRPERCSSLISAQWRREKVCKVCMFACMSVCVCVHECVRIGKRAHTRVYVRVRLHWLNKFMFLINFIHLESRAFVYSNASTHTQGRMSTNAHK